jgi:hypothetical protein
MSAYCREAYLCLERAMLALDATDSPVADQLRDVMDPLWHALTEEECATLDARLSVERPSTTTTTSGAGCLMGFGTARRCMLVAGHRGNCLFSAKDITEVMAEARHEALEEAAKHVEFIGFRSDRANPHLYSDGHLVLPRTGEDYAKAAEWENQQTARELRALKTEQ